MRLLIIGYPRCGKTTMATRFSQDLLLPMLSTDSVITDRWGDASDKVAEWLELEGNWVIEGCSGVRGLRKFLKEGKIPDFQITWLDKPFVPLTAKQMSYGSGCATVWRECQELMRQHDDYCEQCKKVTTTQHTEEHSLCSVCKYVKG